MNNTDLQAQKTRLIEKLGVQFEKEHQLAPVAARIFATRYFIVKPDLMENHIDELTAKWEAQKCIHKEVLEYKQKSNELNKEDPPFDMEFQKSLLDFLDEATAALNKLKKNINNH